MTRTTLLALAERVEAEIVDAASALSPDPFASRFNAENMAHAANCAKVAASLRAIAGSLPD